MVLDNDQWLGPVKVMTPEADLSQDIKKYLGLSGFSANRRYRGEEKDRIVRLVERLEFIDHLQHIVRLMLPHKQVRHECPNGRTLVVDETMLICGHDFAGLDYDVDALVVYLLLTCIDTVVGHDAPKDPFEWLCERGWPQSPDLHELQDAYSREHGLSKRFRLAFTDQLSDATRRRLASNLAVVKLQDGAITEASRRAWKERSDHDRVKAIADHLYAMRSKFTHISLRSYAPSVEVTRIPATGKGKVLIRRKSGPALGELLRDVVAELADRLFTEARS